MNLEFGYTCDSLSRTFLMHNKSMLHNESEAKHTTMTSSDGIIFRVTGPLWGEFTGYRWISLRKASFGVFFDLCLNKRLSKQSWCQWFDTPSCSLWRHCNVCFRINVSCNPWGIGFCLLAKIPALYMGSRPAILLHICRQYLVFVLIY